MGVLNFLKKKNKVEPIGLTPISEHPDDLRKELLGGSTHPMGDIPLPPKPEGVNKISDIPLPPKPEGIPSTNSKDDFDFTKNSSMDKVPEPDNLMDDVPKPTDNNLNEPLPSEEEQVQDMIKSDDFINNKIEDTATKSETDQNTKKESSDEFDFSLPDFSEDDMNVSKKSDKITDEEKEEELPFTTETKEDEKTDFTKDTDSETNENILSTSSKEEKPIMPITKTEDIGSSKKYFVSLNQCDFIFEKISLNQNTIKDMINDIQKQDSSRKSTFNNYKLFHEDLDTAQEKLMQMDNSLFER